MALGSDALARQAFPPAAPRREAPQPLAPLQFRRVRRNRPVAILKIPRSWTATPFGRPAGSAEVVAAASRDGLDAFGSETDPRDGDPHSVAVTGRPETRSPANWLPTAGKWAAVILLSAGLALALMYGYQHRFGRTAATGIVTLETTPPALDVVIAGKTLGKTPLTTSLTPGTYDVQIGSAAYAKTIKLVVTAGTSTVQRVEFAGDTPLAAAPTGGLRVQTEPPHLPVAIDGTPHGASPVAIDKLQPGEHEVSVRTSTGIVRRTVSIQPRETVSLIVSTATAPPADTSAVSAGWISVTSPVPLQLREGGKVIGTSESDRLMLTAGDHEIEFVNQALGFTTKRTVRVTAGKTAATRVDLPNGVVSINAQPWAEVWIDGERIGETPIGNLSRRVGTHEVIFRHPELGERRESLLIVVGKPARIGVDLRKK